MDNTLTFFLYMLLDLGILFIGILIGMEYMSHRLYKAVEKIAKENGIPIVDNKISLQVPLLSAISENGTVILYDEKETFLCQADSLEELAKHACQHKDIKLATVIYNGASVWFIDGEVRIVK